MKDRHTEREQATLANYMTERPRPAMAKETPSVLQITHPKDLWRLNQIASYWRGMIATVGKITEEEIILIGREALLQDFMRFLQHRRCSEVSGPRQLNDATTKAMYYRGVLDAECPTDPAWKRRLEWNSDPDVWHCVQFKSEEAREVHKALSDEPLRWTAA